MKFTSNKVDYFAHKGERYFDSPELCEATEVRYKDQAKGNIIHCAVFKNGKFYSNKCKNVGERYTDWQTLTIDHSVIGDAIECIHDHSGLYDMLGLSGNKCL